MKFGRLALAAFAAVSQAAAITNKITGVGSSDNPINPYLCIQDANGELAYSLAPGMGVDGNQYSGNPYYVGMAIRFVNDPNNPCQYSDPYLGYVGVSAGNGYTMSYSPPAQGVHIAYNNRAIDSKGTMTGNIEYTEIVPNYNLPSPAVTNGLWEYIGVNFAGLEFSNTPNPYTAPNFSEEDQTTSNTDLATIKAFIESGANTVRLPVHWGYVQPDGVGKGNLYTNYVENYVKPQLKTLTQAKVNVIVDLHAYFRYSEFGKQYAGCTDVPGVPCPDGTPVNDSVPYVDVWTKIYDDLNDDPNIDMNYVQFDLSNEPVDVPDDKVFTVQMDVTKALQQAGFKGKTLVSGNGWDGLHSWTTLEWTGKDGTTYTNAKLFTRENMLKAGIDPEKIDQILINVHQYLDSNYSGTGNSCQTDLSTTGPNGFNLQVFADYLKENQFKAIVTEFGSGSEQSTCVTALKQFLDYLKANAASVNKDYGFVGGTLWSAGHGWGMSYPLLVTPTSYQWQTTVDYIYLDSELNPSVTPMNIAQSVDESEGKKVGNLRGSVDNQNGKKLPHASFFSTSKQPFHDATPEKEMRLNLRHQR